MEESKKGTFRILLVGLPGVGKRTIVSRFKEGYSEFNKRVKSSTNLSSKSITKLQFLLRYFEERIKSVDNKK